jgi:hypothetical protein
VPHFLCLASLVPNISATIMTYPMYIPNAQLAGVVGKTGAGGGTGFPPHSETAVIINMLQYFPYCNALLFVSPYCF